MLSLLMNAEEKAPSPPPMVSAEIYWAILPDWLPKLHGYEPPPKAQIHVAGHTLDIAAGRSSTGRHGGDYMLIDGVAFIPVVGVLLKGYGSLGYGDQIDVKNAVQGAAVDPSVKALFLYIDSPGGSVSGTGDAAEAVRAAAKLKPVIAFAEDCCCSAAYWIASQASAIYCNQLAMVGSIGVVTALEDWSQYYEKAGVKVHPIATGKFKNVGDPSQRVEDEHKTYVQDLINSIYGNFAGDVAKGRRLGVGAITAMEARVYLDKEAVAKGLVNGVMNFDKAFDLARRAANDRGKGGAYGNANNTQWACMEIEEAIGLSEYDRVQAETACPASLAYYGKMLGAAKLLLAESGWTPMSAEDRNTFHGLMASARAARGLIEAEGKSATYKPLSDRRVAIHEAAHAVLCCHFGLSITSATINPTEDTLGTVNGHFSNGKGYAVMCVAGQVADQIEAGKTSFTFDWRQPDGQNCESMLAGLGMTKTSVVAEAATIVRQHWSAIERVATALQQFGTISGERVKALYEGR